MISTAAGLALLVPATAMAHSFSVGSRAATCYSASLNFGIKPSAVDDCTAALDQEALSFSDRVATYVNRGIIRMNMGDHAGADRDFDTAAPPLREEHVQQWCVSFFVVRNAMTLEQPARQFHHGTDAR